MYKLSAFSVALNWTGLGWAGLGWAALYWAGLYKLGCTWLGSVAQGCTGLGLTGLHWAGLCCSALGWAGLLCNGLGLDGLHKVALSWARLLCTGRQNWALLPSAGLGCTRLHWTGLCWTYWAALRWTVVCGAVLFQASVPLQVGRHTTWLWQGALWKWSGQNKWQCGRCHGTCSSVGKCRYCKCCGRSYHVLSRYSSYARPFFRVTKHVVSSWHWLRHNPCRLVDTIHYFSLSFFVIQALDEYISSEWYYCLCYYWRDLIFLQVKPKGVTTQMKAVIEYILMVLFVLLPKRVHFLANET